MVMGRIGLAAPTLSLCKVTNAVIQARRRGRISGEQAEYILASFEDLERPLGPVT